MERQSQAHSEGSRRIIREEALLCQLKRRWVPTTDSQPGLRRYQNLVKGGALTGLNQVWVAEITSIRLPRAFASRATVLDAFSKRGAPPGPGWALSRWLDTTVALPALDQTLATREIPSGVIHHSDQGVQDASGANGERLRAQRKPDSVGLIVEQASKARDLPGLPRFGRGE